MISFRRYLREFASYDPRPFDDLVKLTTLVAKGVRRSLFVYGGPGTGKSWLVTDTLNNLGMKKDKDWFMFSGKVTTVGLYRTLFLLRNDKLIIFDDADAAFDNPEAAAILKAALDTQTRSLNWLSTRTVNVAGMSQEQKDALNKRVEDQIHENPDNEKIRYPSEFYFTSRVIFISNKTSANIDSAVLSRVLKIDMTLDPAQYFKRMANLIHGGSLGPKGMSEYDKIDILNTLIRLYNIGKLQQPNLRTFVAATELKDKGEEDWVNLLKYT